MNQCTGKKRARGGSEKVESALFSLILTSPRCLSWERLWKEGRRIRWKLCCPNMNLDSLY